MSDLLDRLWRCLFFVVAMLWVDIMPSADWRDLRVSACLVFCLVMAVSCVAYALRDSDT